MVVAASIGVTLLAAAVTWWRVVGTEVTEMMTVTGPTIEVRQLSKWFGSVVALSDVSFDVGPGRHGAARSERRRQVDPLSHHVRAGQPVARGRCASSARTPAPTPP